MKKNRNPLDEKAISILADLGEYPLSDTRQIHRRHFSGRTLRRVQQKMAALDKAGFVSAFRVAENWLPDEKDESRVLMRRCPTMYGLTEKGRDAVEQWTGEKPFRRAPRDVSPMTLRHRHGVGSVRIALDDACVRLGTAKPNWLLESDVRPSFDAKLPPNQRSVLYHGYEVNNRRIACRPDAVCRLVLPGVSPTREATPGAGLILAFEIDLSTEGLKQLAGSKPVAYEQWLQHKTYEQYWNQPCHKPFLMWVIRNEKRMDTIVKAFQSSPCLPYCRFLVAPTWNDCLLTDRVWLTSDGDRCVIFNKAAAA